MDGAGFSLNPVITRFFYLKQVTSYATTSSMVLLCYDFATTFGQEVELVWFSPWSLPKIVYLLNRYLSVLMAYMYMFALFFGAHTPTRCYFLGILNGWYSWISTCLVQLVLQLWLYALYNRNRRLAYPLSVVYVVLSAVVCGIVMPAGAHIHFIISDPVCVDVMPGFKIFPSFSDNIEFAMGSKFPPYSLTIVMLWASYTVFLLGLMVYKVAVTFRHQPRDGQGLAAVLIRDSLCYCLILLCVVLLNALMVAVAPYALYQVGFGFNAVLPSVLSSRILINLRAWEKCREDRVDVNGLALDQWETMFHITT